MKPGSSVTGVEDGLRANAAEALRTDGAALVEALADYLETVGERRVFPAATAAELADRFDDPLPRSGVPADEVWSDAWSRIMDDAIHLAHPMYMGHQVAPPLAHAVLADTMVSLFNQSTAVWEMSPTATGVEQRVLTWMKELAGYPEDADGSFVSGGSVANLTGLLAAREAVFPGAWARGPGALPERLAVFTPSHAHYSVERAVGVMGLGSDAVIPVPDLDYRMNVDALARAVAAARADGRVPLAIVATAGCTATGLFDDLAAVARIAEREGIWLHVDAAHGGSMLASDRLRGLLDGIERADSIAWDPHKMMLMPISASVVLVRNRAHLDRTFDQSAPYLFHPRIGETRSRDMGKRTLQCSRRFDALKLWIALRHYGLDHFAALQERMVANAHTLHDLLDEATDFQPLHRPESNILCFRWRPEGVDPEAEPDRVNELQTALRERYNASGKGWITATTLDGLRSLRVTLMNPATGPEHLERLVAGLRTEGATLLRATPGRLP